MSSAISTILANLRHTVNVLRSAVYAIDVRDDIADAIDDSADAIEQIYGDVNSASLREDAFAAALQEAIDDNLLPIPATVIDDNSLSGSKIQNASIPLSKLAEPVQITVDSALSGTSTNPVQNKVIKETIDELNGSLENLYGKGNDLPVYGTVDNYALKADGTYIADSNSEVKKYAVTEGDVIYLSLSGDNATTYQFQKQASIVASNPSAVLIGSPVSGDVDKFVKVPTGATYLIVSKLKTTDTNVVKATYLINRIFDFITKEKEIDLSIFSVVPYNLAGNKWKSGGTASYGAILIPVSYLSSVINMSAGPYGIRYAFLKSDTIVANEQSDLCDGQTSSKTVDVNAEVSDMIVPKDCAFLAINTGKDNVVLTEATITRRVGRADDVGDEFRYEIDNRIKELIEIQYEEAMIRTLKHRHDGLRIGVSGTSMVSDNLLVLAHISDPHCDYPVYARFIEFLKRHTDTVSAGIVSGDFTTSSTEAQFNLMTACEDNSVNLIKCVGNHDVRQTDEETYALLNMNTNTGKLYYYVDYPQGIRVIVLFQYDIDDAGSSAIKDATANYSQVQIDWFISTLQDALINNLSVIIVMHGLEGGLMPTYNDKGFCADIDNGYGGAYNPSGGIIFDIVNAFKHGLAINRSYRNSTLTANTEFTSQGEFICYVAGHYHIDRIGYMPNYPDQLMCLIQICAIDVNPGFKRGHDTPRVKGTPTEDCINVYGFDTVSKLVKVARIGATYTDKFIERKCATFEY